MTIERPSHREYRPGDFQAIGPLNSDEIIDEDDDDENWAEPRAPNSGMSRPGNGNGNGNDDTKGEEDTRGCKKETGSGKGP